MQIILSDHNCEGQAKAIFDVLRFDVITIRRLMKPDSLPVLTIGNLQRINADPVYRKACAERLAEIVDELHKYRGITRLYLP